jgi:uncharacterized protein (TIGR02284 family)
MAAAGEHTIRVINNFIETTLDSANGHQEAAENSDASKFKTMFSQRSQSRRQLVQALQQEVRNLGGEPEQDQSAAQVIRATKRVAAA